MRHQILHRFAEQRNTGNHGGGVEVPRCIGQLVAALHERRDIIGILGLVYVHLEFADSPAGILHVGHPEAAREGLASGQAGLCQAVHAQGTRPTGKNAVTPVATFQADWLSKSPPCRR